MLLEHLPTPSPPLPSLLIRRYSYPRCALGRLRDTGDPDLATLFEVLVAVLVGPVYQLTCGRGLVACGMRP
jgi:hypothetical protein